MSSRGPEFGCIMDALEAARTAEALTPSRWDLASQALATRPARAGRYRRGGCSMTSRLVALIGGLALGGLAVAPHAQSVQPAAPRGQELRTPWGDPDLQGIWSGETLTPLQRPARFASRAVLTPEEAAKVAAEVLARPGRENRSSRGTEKDVAGAYNQIFVQRGTELSDGRTSLIVDPPDGRIPPLTPEARKRVDAVTDVPAGASSGNVRRQAGAALAQTRGASSCLQRGAHESRRWTGGPLIGRTLSRRPSSESRGGVSDRAVAGTGGHLSRLGTGARVCTRRPGDRQPRMRRRPSASGTVTRAAGGRVTPWLSTSRISVTRGTSRALEKTCT